MNRAAARMIIRFRLAGALPAMALAVFALALPPSQVYAQAGIPATAAPDRDAEPTEAPPRSLDGQLQEARKQLVQARQTRDEFASQRQVALGTPSTTDKRRLLDWLVDLQGEKVKRLEDLMVLQNGRKPAVEDDPLVKALEERPPYSALKIDALRDEIDGLKENLSAADASMRANQTELQNLRDQLKARSAAVRLATDRMPGMAREPDTAAKEEYANLLRQASETELVITTLDQEALKLRTAALTTRIRDLTAVVARVLPEQSLSVDDLAAQRQRLHAEQDKLAAETAEASKRYARHRSQLDRLGDAHSLAEEETNRRAAFLNLSLKTDNATLKGLDDLQVLAGLSGDSWERRYVVLSSADANQRRAALKALRELRQKLADWRNLSHTRQEVLRTEIREQRMRIGSLTSEGGGGEQEARRLDLLLQQATIDERVELAATRLERQVSRWLADVDAAGGDGFAGRLARLRDRSADMLTRIWQQELFVAEDVSEVDGRRVSVQYGVTVGKSVGIVVVFIFGYWLLARLSGFVQRQLVHRLNLSPQLASVVRRWSMIVLLVALVILLLNLARIPLSVFAFLGGTLAIGVGFGAQTIIKNFISGLIVLFERKVRVGDIVELGGVTGHVTAVDLRATTVRSFNGVEALIPNSNFVENQVVNWTYSNQQIRHELRLGVAYGTDVRQVEALILAVAAEHPKVLDDPAPELFFENFGDSALAVVLVYWVELNDSTPLRRVESDLRYGIYDRLGQAGIGIPFPQRDVRVSFTGPVSVCPTPEPCAGAVNE